MKRMTSHVLTALMRASLMAFSSIPALAESTSSSTITLVERSATVEPLRLGGRGSEVKAVQKRLKELGYLNDSADGVFGPKTEAAVKAFQKRNGLTADGVVGTATRAKLDSSSAKAASSSTSATTTNSTLRSGSTGSEVKELQQRLKELGYYTGSVDGVYGSGTIKAVRAFQERNRLTVDGVAGPSTQTVLYSSAAKMAEEEKSESDESDDVTLRPGSTGNAVKELQYRLKELGYYTGSRDGAYGVNTEAAVAAFQANNGLKADGIAGPDTLEKLYSSSAVKAGSSAGTSDAGSNASTVLLKTNQTLRPGDSSSQVRALQVRLAELGYYTNTNDGAYGGGTCQAVLAFQKNNQLTQDGIAGPQTLEKLVSSGAVGADDIPAGTLVTERLDWFADGEDTFPRNATIQVKDCATGLIFKAKVLYGSNHLDAEPLTASDTDILLDINGGASFSYRRRAVLVQYNGHVYAASIYCEPHGDQTITNNNFDGQFCLHFYGSKTHGSDRVDEDHKECEALALKYTW